MSQFSLQSRPTTPHNGNQLNTPTRATTSNPPTRALYMHQDASHASLHNTCRQGGTNRQAMPSPNRAKVGIAPECAQIRNGGGGESPRRPQARPDSTAQANKVARGIFGRLEESGGERRTTGPAWGRTLNIFVKVLRRNRTPAKSCQGLPQM